MRDRGMGREGGRMGRDDVTPRFQNMATPIALCHDYYYYY